MKVSFKRKVKIINANNLTELWSFIFNLHLQSFLKTWTPKSKKKKKEFPTWIGTVFYKSFFFSMWVILQFRIPSEVRLLPPSLPPDKLTTAVVAPTRCVRLLFILYSIWKKRGSKSKMKDPEGIWDSIWEWFMIIAFFLIISLGKFPLSRCFLHTFCAGWVRSTPGGSPQSGD